jgi:hypothetical protein
MDPFDALYEEDLAGQRGSQGPLRGPGDGAGGSLVRKRKRAARGGVTATRDPGGGEALVGPEPELQILPTPEAVVSTAPGSEQVPLELDGFPTEGADLILHSPPLHSPVGGGRASAFVLPDPEVGGGDETAASWLRPGFRRPTERPAQMALATEIGSVPQITHLGSGHRVCPFAGIGLLERMCNADTARSLSVDPDPANFLHRIGVALSEVMSLILQLLCLFQPLCGADTLFSGRYRGPGYERLL